MNHTRLIAAFMGYTYYHPGVDIDYSDCGGLYTKYEVFSKVQIEVDEYDDQCHFKKLPNPDYNVDGEVKWNRDVETLGWDTLSSGKFMIKKVSDDYYSDIQFKDYHESWDQIMPVVKSILVDREVPKKETKGWYAYHSIEMKLAMVDIKSVHKDVIEYIEWHNYEN